MSDQSGREPTGRCLGCCHPSGSTCGGCGAFVDDGWDGKTAGRQTTEWLPPGDWQHQPWTCLDCGLLNEAGAEDCVKCVYVPVSPPARE